MRSDKETQAPQNSKTSGRGFEFSRSCQNSKLNQGHMTLVLFFV